MTSIMDVLLQVPNARESDVLSITQALSNGGFDCLCQTVDGPFLELDRTTLTGIGLNVLQVAIVISAQRGAGEPTTP